jgi:ABC-type dipeptide/oligopeptide/nickel transport system permease component
MSFWDVVWLVLISFFFVAYLMVMFSILTDLFRDSGTSGWAKAIWVIALIFLPLLTALVYLGVRGRGMAERTEQRAEIARQQQEAYIREAAGRATPADQIAQARALLEQGAISPAEFERLKQQALGDTPPAPPRAV